MPDVLLPSCPVGQFNKCFQNMAAGQAGQQLGIARQSHKHSQFGRMHHRFQQQQKPYLLTCFAVITFYQLLLFLWIKIRHLWQPLLVQF